MAKNGTSISERVWEIAEPIAEELGLSSPRVIYEWTNGNKLPSLVRLVNLADLLNVQMEGLLEIE